MALATLATNKAYLGRQPQSWDPILFGLLLMGTAIVIRRWLASGPNGERYGFTPVRTLSKHARLMTIVSTASAAFQPQNHWESDTPAYKIKTTVNGDRVAQLFFDPASGLLMRLLRFTVTPVAFVPTQLDYADYRELPGLGMKIPFSRTLTQTYMQMTLKFTDVQANVPIDAARFAKPAPAKLQSEK